MKWFTVFPAVRAKVPLVSGENAAMAQVFGQQDQGGIGQVHGQVGVAFHQVGDSANLCLRNIPYSQSTIGHVSNQRLCKASPEARGHEMAGFSQRRPSRYPTVSGRGC